MEGIVSRALAPISSGKIEGVNGFIKAMRRSAFGYQDFDYFALLIWEQTHRKKRQNRLNQKRKTRSYSRARPYNRKRLKQTVFQLPKPPLKDVV